VRKFAESLKGKKVAKVKAFLREIAKKKVAKRKTTDLPELTASTETIADVVKLLEEAGWKDTKELGKEWRDTTVIPYRWEGQKHFTNEVSPTNLLMTPDGKELWRYDSKQLRKKTPLKNGDSLLGGPFIKKAVPEEWKNHKTAWGEIEHYKHYYFHDDYERKFKNIFYEDGKLVIKDE
jgi:tRNA nucleotidyltransferase/poly(A) polymerase